jgi:ribonuclease HIII
MCVHHLQIQKSYQQKDGDQYQLVFIMTLLYEKVVARRVKGHQKGTSNHIVDNFKKENGQTVHTSIKNPPKELWHT